MFSLKFYVRMWLIICLFMMFEYYFLNHAESYSTLAYLKRTVPYFKDLNLTTKAGKPISWYLGWAGFLTMCLTNLYTFRKKYSFLRKVGTLSGWLDFHIFCGLVGPTFILFHTDFKVNGLVAISFWSMVISFSSGIVGRYFYTQLLQKKDNLLRGVEQCDAVLVTNMKAKFPHIPEENIERIKFLHLQYVGAGASLEASMSMSILGAMMKTLTGDLRRIFLPQPLKDKLPTSTRKLLKSYALSVRRLGFMEQFQNIMGYWHSFHTPFAIFMYVVGIIHIVTALMFTTSIK